jgi:hypothetical protein
VVRRLRPPSLPRRSTSLTFRWLRPQAAVGGSAVARSKGLATTPSWVSAPRLGGQRVIGTRLASKTTAVADTKLVKSAGEHWVCRVRSRPGWTAALTRDGIARTDVLAANSATCLPVQRSARLRLSVMRDSVRTENPASIAIRTHPWQVGWLYWGCRQFQQVCQVSDE